MLPVRTSGAVLHGIYTVLDRSVTGDLVSLLRANLRAGVRLFQYRSKSGIDRCTLEMLCTTAHAYGALVIVNDDLDAAAFADGVHVGQEDLEGLDPVALRATLGSRLLGVSCATPDEARRAELLGADYLGVGPLNVTATKHDAGPAIGAEGVARVVAASRLPVAAIGGIGLADLARVRAAGAQMAAIVSAIARAADPEAGARSLIERWSSLDT